MGSGLRALSLTLCTAAAALLIGMAAREQHSAPSSRPTWYTSELTQADQELIRNFQKRNATAFIVGATGEVGKALVRELLETDGFARVVTLGRRPVAYNGAHSDKLVQITVESLDNLEPHADQFNHPLGFCCLGTTRAKSGVEGFKKVDHDYVVNVARVARQKGCENFNLVTSAGSNKNSLFLYPATKGLAEQDVAALQFPRLTIYRPAFLECEREEKRSFEHFYGTYINPILKKIVPTRISVHVDMLARAMRRQAMQTYLLDHPEEAGAASTTSHPKVEILENPVIQELGSDKFTMSQGATPN